MACSLPPFRCQMGIDRASAPRTAEQTRLSAARHRQICNRRHSPLIRRGPLDLLAFQTLNPPFAPPISLSNHTARKNIRGFRRANLRPNREASRPRCALSRRTYGGLLRLTCVGPLRLPDVYSKLPVAPWKPLSACLKSHFITRAVS
jgi:hypothetical protein